MRNEFAKRADTICDNRNTELFLRVQRYVQERKSQGADKSTAALQVEAVDEVFIPGVEGQVKAFHELDLPEGEEEEAKAFIAAMEEGIETTERTNYTTTNVEELGHEFADAIVRANAFGIGDCGFGA